jgi:hypothetical protein
MATKRTRDDYESAAKASYSIAGMCRHLGIKPCGGNYKLMHNAISKYNLDVSHFRGQGWNVGLSFKPCEAKPIHEILTQDSTFQSYKLKNRLLKEGIKQHKCECCGISEWQNQPIVLQLHHIDGNSNHNVRDNLMLLCPNCHSQTDNWCNRKNINSKQITDSQFLEALENAPSICAACRELGITPNQNNYRRARKLIENSES